MTGIMLDEGLQGFMQQGLYGGPLSPSRLAPYKSSATPTPATVFAALDVDVTKAQVVEAGWIYSLDSIGHVESALVTVPFVFTSFYSGFVYYGVCLFSYPGNKSLVAQPFPAPYTVPLGGGTLIVPFTFTYHQC